MINLTLNLPKELEKHLYYLEMVSKRPKDFIVQEALIQYLEDVEDKQKITDWIEKKDKKCYTNEEIQALLEKKGLTDV